jgi:alkylhydroperoxidase family enzyme
MVAQRGRVTDADFEVVRRAGFGDGEIAAIIAHVALNVFTNYCNTATEVEVDFPKIALRKMT